MRAFELKVEREDELLWRQGLYIKMAIGSCFSKSNQHAYPKVPMIKDAKNQKDPDFIKNDIKTRFLAFAEARNAQLRSKKGNGDT